jgi:hypothetical protein
MIRPASNERWWKWLFFAILLAYALVYAPYGVNETDGGFLTGLAWQVLNGKMLYRDVLYVRPPLPVWLHAGFLQLWPEQGVLLAERWLFYGKVALYSWLAADLLATASRRWLLAMLGFVVSVHSYPPMAWHTVDGILFGVLALWLFYRPAAAWMAGWGGVVLVLAMLCKQSFYPLALVWSVLLWRETDPRRAQAALAGFVLAGAAFLGWLWRHDLLESYSHLTAGAAGGGQALRHGLIEYFDLAPAMLIITGLLLVPAVGWALENRHPRRVFFLWALWLLALVGSFAWTLWRRQEPTVPFTQVRLLFWTGVGLLVFQEGNRFKRKEMPEAGHLKLAALLAVSWCAAISWGYSLPALLSTPWVFAAILISERLWNAAFVRPRPAWVPLAVAAALLVLFRWGYEFVYRDGRRSAMDVPMGGIFPALDGLRSDEATAALYRDLKNLAERYGPGFKTLPAFPQANFLTRTPPPLPLDWVVRRETNGHFHPVMEALQKNRPVLFIEKRYARALGDDPELAFVRTLRDRGRLVEETPHFWVLLYE